MNEYKYIKIHIKNIQIDDTYMKIHKNTYKNIIQTT